MAKKDFDLPERLMYLNQGLLSERVSFKDASEVMSNEIRPYMVKYMNMGMNNQAFTDADKQNVFMMLRITSYIFEHSGEPTGLSDTEYDVLYEIYINFGNEDMIGAENSMKARNTASHMYPSLRGTLTKVYYLYDNEVRKNPTRKYLSDWIKSRESEIYDKTGEHVNLRDEEIYVFPKWDGVSCIFEFNPDGSLKTALTRGNVYTNIAQDITKSFPNMVGKKTPNGYGLKTEIMMKEDQLSYYNEKYGTDYKNTRSIVASILNSDNNDERNNLLVIQRLRDSRLENGIETLQVLDDGAFESPFIKCKLGDADLIKEFAEHHRWVDGLRCDGAVIYLINERLQKILGRENNKNRYEVAYKFTEEATLTTLKGVDFQLGIFGEIAPVAKVEPVKLKGNTIKKISLGSIQRFHDLKLRKGDTVKVLYDIIPYLVFDDDCKHTDNKKIKAPTTCPCCGEELEKNEEGYYVRCINPDCEWRKKGSILNYLQKIGIKNISTATINDLYDAKLVREIPDLYDIKEKRNEMLAMDGYGEATVDLIINSICTPRDIKEADFFAALGIPSISTKTFQKLFQKIDVDVLLRIAEAKEYGKLLGIPSIKDKTAKKIIDGINERATLFYKLSEVPYINLIKDISDKDSKFTLVCTKVDAMTKDSIVRPLVEKYGGKMVDTLTKECNILVIPSEEIFSNKITKAEKLGIPKVTLNNLEDFLKSYTKGNS